MRVSIGVMCLVACLVTSEVPRVAAGSSAWTSLGPGGGLITALAIDPTAPTTLYAGTLGGGVFHSTDGGGSWTAINAGLTNLFISALAMTPATLYAGTGASVFAMPIVASC